MFTSKKRVVHLIIVSSIFNFAFSFFVYWLRLPMWLDTVGTIYIAILLGSSYGFCVGLVNNLLFSVILYGYNSTLYYIVSFFVALISGTYSGKAGLLDGCKTKRESVKSSVVYFMKWLVLGLYIFVVSSVIATFFTIVIDYGIPTDYWGNRIYESLLQMAFSGIISTAVSVTTIKLVDVAVTLIIVRILISITPLKYRTNNECVDLYKERMD